MKKTIIRISIVLTIALLCFANSVNVTARPKIKMEGESTNVEKWIEAKFAKNQTPPFSFNLDGRSSSEFLKTWKWSRKVTTAKDSDAISRQYVWKGSKEGLEVTCDVIGYPGSEAVEWVLHFKNFSSGNSGQISNINVADLDLVFPVGETIAIHYAEGNKISRADYSPRTKTLSVDDEIGFKPEGGRSSSEAFPFYNLESVASGQGVMFSIGWSGTWFSNFKAISGKDLELKAGMNHIDLYLKASEEIRTPSVAFLFWSGQQMDGHNKFRRFLLEHRYRKVNGEVPRNFLSSSFNYRDPQPFGEYSCITSEWAIAMVKRFKFFGLQQDIFWLDAGWHTGASDYVNGKNWANTTGNWTVDSKRFPQGMKAVSDAVHETGAKFMLWFEPERVVKGTEWATEHKEWMLDYPNHPEGAEERAWLLFDLGNDEACDWLCKYYGDLIEENGVDYYRQDCNIKPAVYWAYNDEEGRKGMKEIRHIENLYRFWDYLLERFPNMVIDNCASGGKRLDWETISRSVPLWRSDYYHHDDPDGYQCHTYGLSYFLPIHGTGILLPDQYSFRSSLSSTLICNWKITEKGVSIEEMQNRLNEYVSIRDYYFEDYYPLTGDGDLTGHDVWMAYQMHKSSDDSGIVVGFRREEAKDSTCVVKLAGLNPVNEYVLTDSDSGKETVVSGKELANGLTLVLDKPKSSLLIRYKVK